MVSFITFAKAKELGLKGDSVKLEVEKVGASIEVIKSKKYALTLFDLNGMQIVVEVMGIEKISNILASVNINDIRKFSQHKYR